MFFAKKKKSIRVDGTGKTRLTDRNGFYSASFSPSGEYYIENFQGYALDLTQVGFFFGVGQYFLFVRPLHFSQVTNFLENFFFSFPLWNKKTKNKKIVGQRFFFANLEHPQPLKKKYVCCCLFWKKKRFPCRRYDLQ